jgi:uncharacterized protein YegP (UPF0339 family)
MGKFEVSTRTNGDFQFNLKADNGQVIMTSQGYNSKDACMNGIESVRKNGADENNFEKKEAANGKQFFNLKAGNGQIIGSSQMYADASGRDNGIASVGKNAPDAEIVEVAE